MRGRCGVRCGFRFGKGHEIDVLAIGAQDVADHSEGRVFAILAVTLVEEERLKARITREGNRNGSLRYAALTREQAKELAAALSAMADKPCEEPADPGF
jgi:hypothetical protein